MSRSLPNLLLPLRGLSSGRMPSHTALHPTVYVTRSMRSVRSANMSMLTVGLLAVQQLRAWLRYIEWEVKNPMVSVLLLSLC